ncbi:MAG: hypothetical protein IPL83_06490 [Bdellovibrionales bacterium]|nr:hypothetical protein [Bdellovibrionales bacterium]
MSMATEGALDALEKQRENISSPTSITGMVFYGSVAVTANELSTGKLDCEFRESRLRALDMGIADT